MISHPYSFVSFRVSSTVYSRNAFTILSRRTFPVGLGWLVWGLRIEVSHWEAPHNEEALVLIKTKLKPHYASIPLVWELRLKCCLPRNNTDSFPISHNAHFFFCCVALKKHAGMFSLETSFEKILLVNPLIFIFFQAVMWKLKPSYAAWGIWLHSDNCFYCEKFHLMCQPLETSAQGGKACWVQISFQECKIRCVLWLRIRSTDLKICLRCRRTDWGHFW